MKDKTIAITVWVAVALVAAGLLISAASAYFGATQDDVIQKVKQTENY